MQAIVPALAALDASIVAITPQLPEHHSALIQKHGLAFELLSDPGNEYAARLGLRFALGEGTRGVYQAVGIDLVKNNGEDSWTLPVPARLVVDGGGIVRAVDADLDYTRRPEPEKTLDDVKALA